MKIDMHLHTNASDGTWDPQELLDEIKKNKVDVFAVTDHDTVENITATAELAQEMNKKLIKGVEISATYANKLYHVLAYGIDTTNKSLSELMENNRRLMQEKDEESIMAMINNGWDIDFQDFLEYKNDPGKGGWKALNFLIDKGICKNATDFFDNVFTEFNKMTYPEFASPQEVISKIVSAGGVSVLAHPGLNLFDTEEIVDLLDLFYGFGIQGIEVFHPQHSDNITKTCYQWTNANKVQRTGGSDCHGTFIAYRRIGLPRFSYEDLYINKILDKLY